MKRTVLLPFLHVLNLLIVNCTILPFRETNVMFNCIAAVPSWLPLQSILTQKSEQQ